MCSARSPCSTAPTTSAASSCRRGRSGRCSRASRSRRCGHGSGRAPARRSSGARVGARAGAAIIGGVVLTMLLVMPGNAWRVRRWSERYATCLQGARERAARWLSAHTPPRAAFSISDAGLVPAKAGGRAAIDDFLLNEPVIQRTGPLRVRQRVPMILGRRPDLVVLLSDRADRFHGPYAIDRGLARDPRMRAYRLAAVARGGGTGCRYHLFIHERRDMTRGRSP